MVDILVWPSLLLLGIYLGFWELVSVSWCLVWCVWYLVDAVYIHVTTRQTIHKVSGLKKLPSACLGQVTFHSHSPDGQEIKQLIYQRHCKSLKG